MSNLLALSIDVGAIGWTLLDGDSMKIKDMGTSVFPVGSDNFGMGIREVSKKSLRTQNRVKRMRNSRKRVRRNFLIKQLVANGLCPLKTDEVEREAIHAFTKSQKFIDWIKINPYHLRAKAVQEKITLHELGRIFYHLSKRRGFPFNKRIADMKNNALFRGIPGYGRMGIAELEDKMEGKTLGEYFNSILPIENVSYQKKSNSKVRNRFVSREMYVKEAHKIWETQINFHPELTEDLRNKLIGDPDDRTVKKGIVFYQKPLRSQKYRVGKCKFEPKKSRCAVSNLVYQDLLAFKWINTIKKEGKALSAEERDKIHFFFMTHNKFNFAQIKRVLKAQYIPFNKKDSDPIFGSKLNYQLSSNKLFGLEWFRFPYEKRVDIWHTLYFFNSKEKLEKYAKEKWDFSDQSAKKISQLEIDKRYAPISEKAAKNILYFLKRGVEYELSIVLAGVKNSLNEVWDNIEENDIQFIIRRVVQLYEENIRGGFIPKLQEFLLDEMQFSSFQIKKLYGNQVQTVDVKVNKKFPFGAIYDKEVNDFKNPLLKNSLFQTRKIINGVVDKYGSIDQIKAELNINLKTNKFQRFIYRLDQNRVLRIRKQFIQKLYNINVNITSLNLLKMELWEECKRTCPYTGEPIPLQLLFTEAIAVVYIHPWLNSLNDSSLNKTLCCADFSEKIKDKTPYDYFHEYEPDNWSIVVNRAKELFANTTDFPSNYKKHQRFVKRYYRIKYINNQLDDVNFVSREVACFLSQVCVKVSVSSDYTTDHLIHVLSLDKILDNTSYNFRYNDLRNHGLKSYIVAIRDKKNLEQLAKRNKYDYKVGQSSFPIPHTEFRNEIRHFLGSMLIHHKKKDRIYSIKKIEYSIGDQIFRRDNFSPRGSLHRDSIYGKRKPPNLNKAYHIRKPLESIRTMVQVQKIVDEKVKKAVIRVLGNAKLLDAQSFSPHKVFFRTKANGQLISKVSLPNKNGDRVPINKVRIRESLNTAVKLKKDIDQYVNLRNNHHVMIFKNQEEKLNEEVVSFWEAIKRKSRGRPLYQVPHRNCEIVTVLHINDMFLMGLDDPGLPLEEYAKEELTKHLYRIQKLSSNFYEFRLASNNQLNNTEYPNYIRINNFGSKKTGWLTYNPIKVEVSPVGEIKHAREKYLQKKKKAIL